jgi:hypothetical protein
MTMKRSVITVLAGAVVVVLASVSVSTQGTAGWKMRADRSTSAADPDGSGPIKFEAMDNGFHATNPQAATYFKPGTTATGNYSLKANFTLVKPSGHTNYYGLMFGGADLEGASQTYLYFLIGQDGTFLVKHRAGDATHDVQPRTPHASIKKPDASGKSTNTVEVRVQADKIDYLVNSAVVHSTPKSGMAAKTDGLCGLRVNHQLEVHIDGLAVSKL